MKLKCITIAGFRGFNAETSIDFDERLTLIAAPNSHGKTSISEALEFLLFGATSKVLHADSKEEYKDSYRNRHYPSTQSAFVEATFSGYGGKDIVFRVEMDAAENIRRQVNGTETTSWPFEKEIATASQPFILQHALKYLLLVPPTDRFQGFARLLGLHDVDSGHQTLVKLCTKPEASVPIPAKKLVSDLENLEIQLAAFKSLSAVGKSFKKGHSGIGQAYEVVESRIDSMLGKTTAAQGRLAKIIQARNDATSKIYSGTVGLRDYSDEERAQMGVHRKVVESTVNATFVEDWGKLAVKDALERLKLENQLLELGSQLIAGDGSNKDICPLCEQKIDDSIKKHIAERHAELKATAGQSQRGETPKSRTKTALNNLTPAVDAFQRLLGQRSTQLLRATTPENAKKVIGLFGKDNKAAWTAVDAAANTLAPLLANLSQTKEKVVEAVEQCEEAITSNKIEVVQAESLGTSLKNYLDAANAFSSGLDGLATTLVEPARILQQSIDKLAGTGEMTLLISLIEKRQSIERALRIRDLLASLKELKKHADQAVGEIMEAAIDGELTESVLTWYSKIRTKGDPNVHFSGFEMDRTKTGEFKSRRVKVKAESYGVQLASAVSSLSESKLNALGLCVSIASALRSPGPWEFLVLDDPIQSWDDEHEEQFIQVVRALVEDQGKQIILLSHKSKWVNNVCSGCRTFNGLHYEITGYTQIGPHIHILKWAAAEQRLKEIETIANDPDASGVRLQQAEEEVRLAACQLTADIAKTKLNRETSPHNLNSKTVRAILNEAGCPSKLTDRVFASFESTDDAHHTPKYYQPNVQRIRQHLAALQELLKFHNKPEGRNAPHSRIY